MDGIFIALGLFTQTFNCPYVQNQNYNVNVYVGIVRYRWLFGQTKSPP